MSDRARPITRRDVIEHLAAHDCAPSDGPGEGRASSRSGTPTTWPSPVATCSPTRCSAPPPTAVRCPAGARSPSSPAARWSWRRLPPTRGGASLDALRIDGAEVRRRLADAGFAVAGGRHRPVPRAGPHPHQAALRRHAGLLRRVGSRGPPDDVELRVDPGEHRLRRRRPPWPAAGTSPIASARPWRPPSPARPAPLHRSERLADVERHGPHPHQAGAGLGAARGGLEPTTCSAARLMLLHEDDDSCEPVAVPITFGEWVDEGIAGRRPTLADLDYHCTTLFPPVRPRGWLEVRWLDCLPAGLAEVASAAVTALLHRRATPSDEALEACAGRRSAWRRGPPPRASARRIPTWPPPAAGSLAAAAEALDRTRCAAALGGGRGRRRPSAGRPRAARRPTTSRSAWPPAPRCSTWPTRRWRSRGREHARLSWRPPSTASRARFLAILEPFDEAVLRRQHDVLMSPLLWDLAHVANYEDLWLVRALGGEPTRDGLDDLYDAFKQPRRRAGGAAAARPRPGARLRRRRPRPGPRAARAAPTSAPTAPTRLTAPRLRAPHGRPARAPARRDAARRDPAPARRRGRTSSPPPPPPAPRSRRPPRCSCPAGPSRWARDDPASLDNERPVHEVDVPAFWIDAAPVTNGQYRRFVEDGGYDEPRWWGERGWAWRQEADLVAPQFWRRDGDALGSAAVRHRRAAARRRAGAARRLARGRRLRTLGRPAPAHRGRVGEGRRFDPATGESRRWPWGDDDPTDAPRQPRPAPPRPGPGRRLPRRRERGRLPPDGRRRVGVDRRATSSPTRASSGSPTPSTPTCSTAATTRCSAGSSWATHPSVGRTTFRNWDLPIRRQIFAGFRTARDCLTDVPPPGLPGPAPLALVAALRARALARAAELEAAASSARAP